jgi:glycosyltransferase involved in cell wall biosynthesis
MIKTPLFSIITVCYNSADTIEDTVRSVMSQTCENYEHILIDGASTDDTVARALAVNRNLIIYSEPDKGIYDAMNKGVLRSRGKYINFLNADDFHHPEFLSRNATLIEEDSSIDYLYGGIQAIRADGITRKFIPNPETIGRLMAMPFPTPTIVGRRQLFLDTGLFSLEYKYASDLAWALQVIHQGYRCKSTGQVQTSYRLGGRGNSFQSLRESLLIFKLAGFSNLKLCQYATHTALQLLWHRLKAK